jgi:4-hydroxybenzoate polyprenyltransferase
MTFSKPWHAAWQLLRPGQWPVLTAQFLLAVMLLSPRATAGGCWINGTALTVLVVGWFCWVVLLNGGTLAFNSAYDRDIGPVAYLPNPPEPPRWLAGLSLIWMLAGVVIGTLVIGLAFGLVLGICVVLSVLYSHPATRLKGRPGWDLLINMVGYGAATTLGGLLVGKAAYLGFPAGACATTGPNLLAFPSVPLPVAQVPLGQQFAEVLADGRFFLVLGFGLLFGSFYPGTQIYQAREDRQRGDLTLTTALGIRRALIVSLGLGVLASVSMLYAWWGAARMWTAILPAAALMLWLGHHARWWQQAPRWDDGQHEKGMYRSLTLWAVVDGAVLIGWLFRN